MRSVSAIRSCKVWMGIFLFCLVFSIVYEIFSFGVISIHMVCLSLYPLILGALVSLIFNRKTGRFYNDGVLLLTAASALNGILEIYGTDSVYPFYMILLGSGLILVSVAGFDAGDAYERKRISG